MCVSTHSQLLRRHDAWNERWKKQKPLPGSLIGQMLCACNFTPFLISSLDLLSFSCSVIRFPLKKTPGITRGHAWRPVKLTVISLKSDSLCLLLVKDVTKTTMLQLLPSHETVNHYCFFLPTTDWQLNIPENGLAYWDFTMLCTHFLLAVPLCVLFLLYYSTLSWPQLPSSFSLHYSAHHPSLL